MTLSMEVLPAPFGPMMARTSPFLMSNDTSRIARTPPNARDTFSIERMISPAAMSLAAGALMGPHNGRPPSPGGRGSPNEVRRGGVLLRTKKGHPHPVGFADRPPPSRGR